MDWNFLKSNWALAAASVIGVVAAFFVIVQLISRTGWGQLQVTLKALDKARRQEVKALKSVEKAERIAEQLHENADRAKPRHVQEAKDALSDARMLAKIANDRILVAENHVRLVIHDEYPPVRQEEMRQKYLRDPARDKKPISLE